jgi:Sulfotransferase family
VGGSVERSNWPIVVGGCARSGTSLVRRILDSHSRIHSGPEIKFLAELVGPPRKDPLGDVRFISSARRFMSEDDLLEIVGQAFVALHERAAERVGKPRWADKNPGNVLYVDKWERLLGDQWLLVHVVRNPLDTLASMKQVGFRRLPPGLRDRLDFYRSHLEAGLAFGDSHPDRYRLLLYEELVSSPRNTVEGLMSWLGETFEPVQLRFNDLPHERGLEDPKVAATSEVHADSLGRWREVLSEAEISEIGSEAAELWATVDPEGRWSIR